MTKNKIYKSKVGRPNVEMRGSTSREVDTMRRWVAANVEMRSSEFHETLVEGSRLWKQRREVVDAKKDRVANLWSLAWALVGNVVVVGGV